MTHIAPDSLLGRTLAAIAPVNEQARQQAEAYQEQLTKPAGSLGRLESLGNQLCAICGVCPPPVPTPAMVGVFAGDHGVQAQAVSPWPQEITWQMGANVAAGGASINVLARHAGADVMLYNVGALTDLPDAPNVRNCRVRPGTADMTQGPAMSIAEAIAAIEIGLKAAGEAVESGHKALLTGELGIGNTTPAAALVSVFTGIDPATATGRGAGADDAMLARKREVVANAIATNHASADDPLAALAGVGGLEHAAMVGFILGGAAAQVPVIVDGVIACSAALVAIALCPSARGYLIGGHLGAEPGIEAALRTPDLQPVLALNMRLGEGSGAAAALPVVQASAKILREMATFASAGVTSEHA